MKKFLYIHRRAPHGSNYAQEGLESALIGAAFEQEIAFAFIDDGVFLLKRGQDAGEAGMKNFTAAFGALGEYGVQVAYVERESMQARGMREEDLLPLQNEHGAPLLQVVDADALSKFIASRQVLLNF